MPPGLAVICTLRDCCGASYWQSTVVVARVALRTFRRSVYRNVTRRLSTVRAKDSPITLPAYTLLSGCPLRPNVHSENTQRLELCVGAVTVEAVPASGEPRRAGDSDRSPCERSPRHKLRLGIVHRRNTRRCESVAGAMDMCGHSLRIRDRGRHH